ncbi:dGTPase [Aeromonas schubertii]|uniref:Deoxyguanosinetriphosphate triphosphohydrolase n=1 Tax=Aeromonas schubertii TaxID=652 RepID=A0A0S2SM41_9GAMM|nr:dGTPase [Aeromonas schubertii]ALP42815.1 deoxyguanosinetriphosphate triphosphohydrolase [Aeromonas schubertii]
MYARLIPPLRSLRPVGEGLLEATERDRARIVQAAPVRRLQQKTQVFPLDVKASVRSRLTHSLEVQETGRQIARQILAALPDAGVPSLVFINLVEMASLLHDVGNPPFGHFGEQVIGQWMQAHHDRCYLAALGQANLPRWLPFREDLCHFDGNAQSLRLVHSLHELDLTQGQLAALCKYPGEGKGEGWQAKCGVYLSERPLIAGLWHSLGLEPGARHPLAYIMEAADDISYCIADLEDAVDRRILSSETLQKALRESAEPYLGELIEEALATDPRFFAPFRERLTAELVALAARAYLAEHEAILAGRYPRPLLHGQTAPARALDRLRQVAREEVFLRPEVEALELEGYAALRTVLDTYGELLALPADRFQGLLAGDSQGLFVLRRLVHRLSARHIRAYQRAIACADPRFPDPPHQEWYYRVRLLLDYVSGMTDTYIQQEYRLLCGL